MKKLALYRNAFLGLALLAPSGFAQEKPKSEDKPRAEAAGTTPVRVQVVFSEMEGTKVTKSLPYSMYINAANAPELRPGWTKLRVGSKVPVYLGSGPASSSPSLNYLDVGTNIDARASNSGDGHFLLYLALERSWVEGDVLVPITKSDGASSDSSAGHFREPIIRQFKSELDLKLREGQTIESTMATDPLSGKILRVEITLTAVK
jgi:hypothetical protein